MIANPLHARIKIDNVTNYSFGQDDNGKPVVWAAGKAGWYEINPADRYLSHYNDTIEAIDMFYFMVDQQHALPRKKQRLGFMIDPFLTEYQKHTGFRIDDDDEAMETIHKHHKFLLKQMVEEREGIDWSHTYLWKHLAETYAEEVETLRTGVVQYEDEMEILDEEEVTTEIVVQAEEEDASSSSVQTSSDSSKSSETSDTESQIEEDTSDYTPMIWELLNILRKLSSFNIRDCGIEQLATELQKHPNFPGTHKQAVTAIERSAEPLLRLMNEAKLRKKFNWSTRNIYDELEATLADEVADDVMKTPTAKGGDKRHRMKSVLRPSGAGGKASKRIRGGPESDEDGEMVGEAPFSSPVAGRKHVAPLARHVREATTDSVVSREDSPSRQLNGHFEDLPELPPGPEAKEMLDLVAVEAKRVGRQHQTNNLQAFLNSMNML